MPLDRKPMDEAVLEALVGKVVGELSAGYGGVMIDLGTKLGLFRAMADAGPMTSAEVPRRGSWRGDEHLSCSRATAAPTCRSR